MSKRTTTAPSEPATQFEVGREYKYEELPQQVRDDIDVQLDEYNEDVELKRFVFRILEWDGELSERLEAFYGLDFEEYEEHEDIQELMANIVEHGLRYPPVGIEGWHRSLAHYFLHRDMPFFEIVDVDEEDEESAPSSSSSRLRYAELNFDI